MVQLGLVEIYQFLLRRTYFDSAGVTILVYDYLLTLPHETLLIWPTPWNATKILFLLTRYLPFVDAALHFYDIRLRGVSAETCLAIYKARVWVVWFGFSPPEVILSLRTWAAWDRDRRLAIGLPIFWAMIWLPSIAVTDAFLKAVNFVVFRTFPNSSGCVPIPHRNIARICWILLLTYDAGLCLLMLIRAVKWFKEGCVSKFALTVFRNGLLYYVVLLTISLVNVFIALTWQHALILTQRFIHSIIACRIILDIRGQALKEDDFSVANSFMVDTTLDMSTTFAGDMDYHDEVVYRRAGTGKRGKARVTFNETVTSEGNFLIFD